MKQDREMPTIQIGIKTILWAFGTAGLIYFLFRIQQIVITLFFAVILMSALRPGMRWLERKLKLPRILAILIMYVGIIFLIVFTLTLLIPPLLHELPNFVQTLSLPPIPADFMQLKFNISELSSFLPQIGKSFTTIYAIVSSTFTGVFTFVTVLVMTSYLLLDRERLHLKAIWFTKDPVQLNKIKELIDHIEIQLGGWVRGQLSLMVIIGVITYIGLSLLRLPYALPLAVVAGLLEALPNLGPTLSAIPSVAVAWVVGGPALAIFIVVFYILVQQFENNLIVPKIMQANADVNPLTTILLILTGVKLASVMGALLAVPLYIVLRSIYAVWYREYMKAPALEKTA